MRRTARVALFLVLVMAVTVSPVVTRAAQSRIPSNVAADFDGDGVADLAVGVPGENAAAGAVNVLYGTGGGLSGTGSQLFDQVGSAVEQLDTFGSALAAGDFNRDGFTDLAAGAPGEAVGALGFAGAVSVLNGSAAGLTTAGGRLFTQGSGQVDESDQFGAALAAGDFNADGFADLAVGAPGEAIGPGGGGAGVVSVLYGSAAGLTNPGGPLFDQVGGRPESGDQFGAALAAGDFNDDGFSDLAAGAPGEAVGSAGAAGAVSTLNGSAGGLTTAGGRLFTQVGGRDERFDVFGFALAAGDFNADGSADLAAGAPGETVGSSFAAGAVSTLNGSAAGLTTSGGRLFTQVGGRVEVEDQFGAQLAAGDFNDNGSADLAAAAPLEDLGSIRDAGAVSVLQGSAGGLTASGGRLFTQASPGVVGAAEPNDNFGGWQWVP